MYTGPIAGVDWVIMQTFLPRLSRLVFGLFLFSVGIVMIIKANVGYAPWDVFHAGLGAVSGISFGLVSILVGLVILGLTLLLGEKIGLGTILNMVLIGVFIDLFMALPGIPLPGSPLLAYTVLVGGLFVIALGSWFYIKSGFGAGPRDSLMIALSRKTGLAVGICRSSIEGLAVLGGWLLGGLVGFGTIVAALGIGIAVQLTFKLLNFDPGTVEHENLGETIRALRKN